jgi:hypothetical protein
MTRSLLLALALVTSSAGAQVPESEVAPEASPTQESSTDLTRPAVRALGGILAYAASAYPWGCEPGSEFALPLGHPVVVIRKLDCEAFRGPWPLLEIAYDGKAYFVKPSALKWIGSGEQSLSDHSESVVTHNRAQWLEQSKQVLASYRAQFEKQALKKGSQGMSLVNATVYDISKHTEGTGFEVTVLNTGKRVIKYITFSVVGLNRVGDPVVNPLNGQRTQRFRGVGPITPWTTATFSKDYMWHTDVVDTLRIPEVQVEFMDGSRAVIRNAEKLQLDVDAAMYFSRR